MIDGKFTQKEVEELDRALRNDEEIEDLKNELNSLKYIAYKYYMIDSMKRDIEFLKSKIKEVEDKNNS